MDTLSVLKTINEAMNPKNAELNNEIFKFVYKYLTLLIISEESMYSDKYYKHRRELVAKIKRALNEDVTEVAFQTDFYGRAWYMSLYVYVGATNVHFQYTKYIRFKYAGPKISETSLPTLDQFFKNCDIDFTDDVPTYIKNKNRRSSIDPQTKAAAKTTNPLDLDIVGYLDAVPAKAVTSIGTPRTPRSKYLDFKEKRKDIHRGEATPLTAEMLVLEAAELYISNNRYFLFDQFIYFLVDYFKTNFVKFVKTKPWVAQDAQVRIWPVLENETFLYKNYLDIPSNHIVFRAIPKEDDLEYTFHILIDISQYTIVPSVILITVFGGQAYFESVSGVGFVWRSWTYLKATEEIAKLYRGTDTFKLTPEQHLACVMLIKEAKDAQSKNS